MLRLFGIVLLTVGILIAAGAVFLPHSPMPLDPLQHDTSLHLHDTYYVVMEIRYLVVPAVVIMVIGVLLIWVGRGATVKSGPRVMGRAVAVGFGVASGLFGLLAIYLNAALQNVLDTYQVVAPPPVEIALAVIFALAGGLIWLISNLASAPNGK